jgi:beta-fructofuranosidase
MVIRTWTALLVFTGTAASAAPEPLLWADPPAHRGELERAAGSVAAGIPLVREDRLRPAFHFLPPSRFMNDPNGCIEVDGVYHVFYQHRAFWGEADEATAPAWGHASSRDLMRWEHWPIALMPVPETYDWAAVASGACVVADGWPTIVYTGVPPQTQCLARSFDGMRTWLRYTGNPVVPAPPPLSGLADGFRDPFVWQENGEWSMLVGSGFQDGGGGCVLLYRSADLVDWGFVSVMSSGLGPDCFQWECPSFFRLEDRHVLMVSPLCRSVDGLRAPVCMSVGSFDGETFVPGPWLPVDLGGATVFYAPQTLPDSRGRRLLFGWIMGGGSPGMPWYGMLSLPRELSLGADSLVHSWPAAEVDTLRNGNLLSVRDVSGPAELPVAGGLQLDIDLEIQGQGQVELRLCAGADPDGGYRVLWTPADGWIRSGAREGRVPGDSGDVQRLRVLLDRSVIEVFVDGRGVLTDRLVPVVGDDRLRIRVGTGARVLRADVWRMGEP